MKWNHDPERDVHYRDDFVLVQRDEDTDRWLVVWPYEPGAPVDPCLEASQAMRAADAAMSECLPPHWSKVTKGRAMDTGYFREDGWSLALDGTNATNEKANPLLRATDITPWRVIARIEQAWPYGSFPWAVSIDRPRPWPGVVAGQVWESPEYSYLVTSVWRGSAKSGEFRLTRDGSETPTDDIGVAMKLVRGHGAPWNPEKDSKP